MIERPQRSITRFFVPLIDVLILLFCIFLIMPFVSQPGTMEGGGDPANKRFDGTDPQERIPIRVTELQRELEKTKRELNNLKETRPDLSDRVSVRILEIDPRNGKLYYFQEGEKREVRDQREAQRVIDLHQKQLANREPLYLILYPRQRSGFPEQQQVDDYRRWFQGVPLGFDNPLAPTTP